MAAANPPPGALSVEHRNGSDPFLMAPQDNHRQRYSAFDNSQFSLYLNGSPVQAKRALQAHLAETTRRLQETSHLGNALVQQRKELEDKLQEVEHQQEDNDIGPELRQRLAELEKEFNEVGRETARAFLPKSRVPSGETDAIGGASVYSSESISSPTKVSVPSRKQRNQQPSRINDIALATEISTSLLSQLKELQAVLLEKDEALKAADLDRSQLEIEVEGLSQRLRTLDESESRLKDVNWNLETQVRESEAQSKSAADKEHRLNHALNLARTEASTLEREVEELKQMYAKLNDDHINKTKQHETELSTLRRSAAMAETEKGAMQRKVEELTSKNQELAKAISYRARSEERARDDNSSAEDDGANGDDRTPEHSPPVSPAKPTPRHGQLESETLKHSLQHAHRMIQQLKNNIHREKTEKIELKRMLQDARDELDATRSLVASGSATKRRKSDKDVFKKPARPDRLGAFRTGTQEIVEDVEDDEWEEQESVLESPNRLPHPSGSAPGSFAVASRTVASRAAAYDSFDTANETSDAAFETANEREGMTTESDAFQTGAETLDEDSSDQLTETESPTKAAVLRNRPSIASVGRVSSFRSTASASGDEDEINFRTPILHKNSRLRLRPRDSSTRRSTPRGVPDMFIGTPPGLRDSPASYVSSSNENTPAQGKSLFAELNDLSGDDDDGSSVEGTPSRSSVVYAGHSSPDMPRKPVLERSALQSDISRPMMVDSGMMTESEVPQPIAMSSISSQDTQPQPIRLPTLQMSTLHSQGTNPQALPRPDLRVSFISSQGTEPKQVLSPTLNYSTVSGHTTSPRAPKIPQLAVSSLCAQATEPQAPIAPLHAFSSLHAQGTAPRAVPVAPLIMSSVSTHTTEPRHAIPPSLGLSDFSSQGTDPVVPVVEKTITPPLGVSSVSHQTTEPREPAPSNLVVPAALLTSAISAQSTVPKERSEASSSVSESRSISDEILHAPVQSPHEKHHIPLRISSLSAQSTIPRDVPQKQAPSMQMSIVSSHATEPRDVPQSQPALLQMSTLSANMTEPRSVPQPTLSVSSTTSIQSTEPLAPSREKQQFSLLSSHATEPRTPQVPVLQISGFSSRSTEPVQVPKAAPRQLSSLSFQASNPVEPSRPTPFSFSVFSSQATEPLVSQGSAPASFSSVTSQGTEPIQPIQQAPQVSAISALETEPFDASSYGHHFSDVRTIHDNQPESPTLPAFLPSPAPRPSTANRVDIPAMSLSALATQGTEPLSPPRPVTAQRAAVTSTATASQPTEVTDSQNSSAHKLSYFGAVLPRNKSASSETTTSPIESRDARVPLAALSTNTVVKAPRAPMADGGTQTMVSAEQIDKLLLARSQRWSSLINTTAVERALSTPESPSRRQARESSRNLKRPDSSGSMRSRAATPPPLPSDHKEAIAAASLRPMSPGGLGTMGPPSKPASAYKKRPLTPTIKTSSNALTPKTGGTTPRVRRQSHRSGASSPPLSHRSSLSSFTSELDQRFNIPGGPSFATNGISTGATDPRMIQAITQTMIGEYLWKYTRKTGREGMSENRHRRFFWIHPYTRTLYWSDRDPQSADKSTLKAKSVAIESVFEVDDPNPLPPGLHQKSLLVITPGRSMKFTATTGQRHETWYNALNYLCQRVQDGGEQPEKSSSQPEQDPKAAAADEIQDEFNGGYRSTSRQTGRTKASYTIRHEASRDQTQVPTIRQSTVKQHRASSIEPPTTGSVSSRFSMLRPSVAAMRGSFASRRNSKTSAVESVTYEEPSASALDLGRDIHEHVEQDQDHMPNVRACCDGKKVQKPSVYSS
ncbi:anucleate primary sterigmata a [Pyrenophora seminiperda CCB06]|uniref:Anucleate primary sterigmata a n=1 Tax=Pyrenophora seminiperda CCB06 TaxID=1302712 RepID=A0A3M7M044_9PLEO|nr:anucleate primary sterigmata a [Pyrenophora seminiperda CCB06]